MTWLIYTYDCFIYYDLFCFHYYRNDRKTASQFNYYIAISLVQFTCISGISVVLLLLLILAPPQVSLKSVKLKEHQMTVTWSYVGQSMRLKRSTSPSVSVVVYYQPDGGEEAHYPPDGQVAAKDRQVVIKGKFDINAKYKVWLKIYEGSLAVSFQKTIPLEAVIETGTVYH